MRMKSGGSLKSYQRLIIFLLFVLAITCVISPWMALAAEWIHVNWPSLIDERVPFPRVFNRAFMVAGIIGFIVARKFIFPPRLKPLLLPGFGKAIRLLSLGWIISFVSTTLLVCLMAIGDVFEPFFRLSLAESISRLISAFFAGIFAGFLEEIFFRGILFLGLRDDGRPVAAYMFANLFYSALHFVKPGEPYFLNGINPLAGFRHLLTTFEPFVHPIDLLPGIFGLFLIGVILSYALVRTGHLYLSIGLHAGWVFGLKVIRVFGDFSRQDLGWIFGSTDPKIVSGVASWIGLLLVAVVVRQLTRHEQPRKAPGLS
jgi:membrane protease YdiL (CAAX protease family)